MCSLLVALSIFFFCRGTDLQVLTGHTKLGLAQSTNSNGIRQRLSLVRLFHYSFIILIIQLPIPLLYLHTLHTAFWYGLHELLSESRSKVRQATPKRSFVERVSEQSPQQ